MAVPMYPVTSSQISYIGYENETNSLYVTFKNGSKYVYKNVSKEVFDDFLHSDSIGKYFIVNIKDNYTFNKI